MFKRYLPCREKLKNSRFLRWLGPRIHDPSLWHFSRRAVARGAAVGAFFGLLIPVAQIPVALLIGLVARANLWVAAATTLISNPFTYGPLYYFAYRLGSRFTEASDAVGGPGIGDDPGHTLEWMLGLWTWFAEIGRPLALGLLIMAVVAAALGYWMVLLVWRLKVVKKRRQGRQARSLRAAG